jgi:uncharacterized membrane protein YdjX (TVP38/TMEM64 family)
MAVFGSSFSGFGSSILRRWEQPKETAMKTNMFVKTILVVTLLVALWGVRDGISAVWAWFSNLHAVTNSMEHAGLWGPVVLFILFVLQVFLAFIPGQALMVACGYLYGFWGGFLLSWLSLVVGGEAAYVLARKFGRPFAERWISPEVLSRWDQAAAGQGIGFFAVMLVMPLVPNDAMCYVAGLGTISHRRFTFANLLGRGMACVITSAAGVLGGQLSWQGWAIIVALFVLVGVIWHLVKSSYSNLLIA